MGPVLVTIAFVVMLAGVFLQAAAYKDGLKSLKQEVREQSEMIDSLRAVNDTLNHELRFFRRYVRPDSAWVHEQVSAHGVGGPEADRMVRAFIVYGMETGVSPRVLAATGRVESAFRPDAVSRKNAHGLMQVVPFYWWNVYKKQCGEWNPYNPSKSICYGAHIIRYELDRWGTLHDAMSAYNAGYPAYRSTAGNRYANRVASFVGGS